MSDTIAQVNSIFQQPWWLDAVAAGNWDAAIVKNGDEVVARLPFVVKKRLGLTLLTMPPLTQTLGPWIVTKPIKYTNRLGDEIHLCDALIEQLPRYDYFLQQFSPTITNWLPFYWAGFSASINYTYRLEELGDLDRIWSGMRSNIRGKVRKAQTRVHIRDDLDIEIFFQVWAKTFSRQRMRVAYDFEQIQRLDYACSQHGARHILFAEDAQGRIHAVAYIVWDTETAYYLLSGGDPSLRDSGAQSLLLWEAIKFAAGKSKCFDFEGSMLAPVEEFFRAFGAQQVPYFGISNASRRMRFVTGLHQMFTAVLGQPLIRAIDTTK